jgi:hypothetical protein
VSKSDPLLEGRQMIEGMLRDCKKEGSKIPFEDKLKLLDRWIKFQDLEHRRKQGGMGKGFDEPGENEDGDGSGL